ncbi:MAG TPA: helix-turn-helix domain-containing protein [Anaerovoracaceae bacterium]|nr:helix-turn-helix domain-containing protein [Anaerovoracaceae bacterium]
MSSSAIMSKLRHVGELFYVTTHICTLAIDLGNRKLVEIPKNHLNNCLCQRMRSITGIDASFDHVYNLCTMTANINRQIIYRCPYDFFNIIVPVFEDNQLVAALQGGPILTYKPEVYLEKVLIPYWNPKEEYIPLLLEELSTYPSGDINHVIALSEIMSSLVHADHIDTRSRQESDDFSEHEQCSNLIVSILNFVTANYAENITLGDAAKYAYVNPSHLSRIFNREMNCNFRSYLNGIRIEKAKDLLCRSELNIVEICNRVGFCDQSYFNKIFKQMERVTPGQYRKQTQAQWAHRS